MFVKLYLEPDDDGERDKRRRAARARRRQTRTVARAPVHDRDRPSRR